MAILQTRELKKYYGAGDTLVKALDGVELSVENGEFVAIIGTSGSGKSTLLHMLGGLDRPTSGTVTVDGRELSTLKDEELTIFRRRKIGFVFQAYNLVPVLSVYENIVLPIQLDGGAVDESYVREVIAVLGLEKKLDSLPGQAVQLLLQPQDGDHLPDVALVHRAAVQLNGEDDVLIYAEHRHQIIGLEHEADLPPPEDGQLLVLQGGQLPAVHRHRAGGGPVQPAQHVQQGGLARPRRADDSHELAVLHAQLHPVQGFHQGVPRAIIFLQFPGLQNRHLESPPVEKMGTAF